MPPAGGTAAGRSLGNEEHTMRWSNVLVTVGNALVTVIGCGLAAGCQLLFSFETVPEGTGGAAGATTSTGGATTSATAGATTSATAGASQGGAGGSQGGGGGDSPGSGGSGGCISCKEATMAGVDAETLCTGSYMLYEQLVVCICRGPCAGPCAGSVCAGANLTPACQSCIGDAENGCGNEYFACIADR
jgi:hypothetical protein